ncbi:hypothetical protein PsYK624_092290 [Phanerochaete sordida]|uniref:Uncharacterized protein n=1 Tax=Phanerochaete sordida TaxID=48140 RepID=A0A9P3LF92_9APHY|nr:hypothetical protein PsYK624_092290 [Phanerochaete sordida]
MRGFTRRGACGQTLSASLWLTGSPSRALYHNTAGLPSAQGPTCAILEHQPLGRRGAGSRNAAARDVDGGQPTVPLAPFARYLQICTRCLRGCARCENSVVDYFVLLPPCAGDGAGCGRVPLQPRELCHVRHRKPRQ